MPLRVLFVDDEPMMRSVILRSYGEQYEIVVAESGVEAIEVMRSSERFDVVITDMRMPRMSGLKLAESTIGQEDAPPFILLTGNQDPETHDQAAACPAIHRCLLKPCGHDEIAAAIEEVAQAGAASTVG